MKFSKNHNIIKNLFLLFYVVVSSKAIENETKSLLFANSLNSHDHRTNITSPSSGNINGNGNTTTPFESNSNNTISAFVRKTLTSETKTHGRTEGKITIVPTWIKRQRATKVLEKPLESQLVSFHELETGRGNDREKFMENLFPLSSSSRQSSGNATTSLSPTRSLSSSTASREIPPVQRVLAGVQKRDNPLIPFLPRRRLKTKEPIRKQDVDFISLVEETPLQHLPPPPLPTKEFTSFVSPLEASHGGLTGLQGLPPLSFVQFVKLLVAVTPFLIPIIFIPLLLFTLGILMIPVTRSNVFVDLGDLRRSSISHPEVVNHIQSFLSSYFLSPAKTFTGKVVMPRAYQFANQLIEHEQCVERISCEISQRYLPYPQWSGTWRSVANRSWISRIITYLGKNRPTLLRIARSFHESAETVEEISSEEGQNNQFGRTTGGNTTRAMVKEDKDTANEVPEISRNREKRESEGNATAHEHERSFINGSACRKYVCQPKSFLRRLFS